MLVAGAGSASCEFLFLLLPSLPLFLLLPPSLLPVPLTQAICELRVADVTCKAQSGSWMTTQKHHRHPREKSPVVIYLSPQLSCFPVSSHPSSNGHILDAKSSCASSLSLSVLITGLGKTALPCILKSLTI